MEGKQPLNTNSAGYQIESHRDQGASPVASSRPDPELPNKKNQKSCMFAQTEIKENSNVLHC